MSESPPFFRTCPFCRVTNITITSYGRGVISCDCGIGMTDTLTSWDKLQDAAEDWNRKLREVEKQKGRGEYEDDK